RAYYRDALVLAFPSLEGEERPLRDLLRQVTSSSGAADANLLTDSGLSMGVEIRPAAPGQPAYLQLEFHEPYAARSIEVWTSAPPHAEFLSSFPSMALEASDDGVQFRKLCDLDLPQAPGGLIEVPSIANFPLTRAKFFRLASQKSGSIAEIRISGAVRIPD